MTYQTSKLEGELEELIYTSDEVLDDKRCSHHFKRVSPYNVECSKCHVGYQDSPDSPFPVDELNEYYELPNVKQYNKWL